MAGVLARVNSGEVSIANGVTKTVLQLRSAANHRVKIIGVGISFKGIVSNDKPMLVEIVRQTDGGTASAATPFKNNDGDVETIQTTAQKTFTVEPSVDSPAKVLYSVDVHPQGGWQIMFPYGQEIILPGATTYYLGLRVTSAVGNATTDCVAQFDFEE